MQEKGLVSINRDITMPQRIADRSSNECVDIIVNTRFEMI